MISKLSITKYEYNKSFILVRHGESIWNKDSKFTGWTNIPLTIKGEAEAMLIGKSLIRHNIYPDIIFTSVLDRCIDTSNIIKDELNTSCKTNIPIHTSWRLNERHYGMLEGIPRQYIRDTYGEDTTKLIRCNFRKKIPILENNEYINYYPVYKNCYFEKIKYGETHENVLERVMPYYENDILYTLSQNMTPLIVTHKHTARVLMKHLLQISDKDFENYELPNKKILFMHLKNDFSYDKHHEISY